MGGHSPDRFLLQALHRVVFSPSSLYVYFYGDCLSGSFGDVMSSFTAIGSQKVGGGGTLFMTMKMTSNNPRKTSMSSLA